MQLSTIEQHQKLTCPELPLAVYREIAAHIRQVEGVQAKLILRPVEHQPGAKFDYYQSQIASLEIIYTPQVTERDKQRVTEILDYYAERYRPWESTTKPDR